MASSVDLFVFLANWWGSKLEGRESLLCFRTSLLKHLATTGVRVMVRKSLGPLTVVDWERGLWGLISGIKGWWFGSVRGWKIFVNTVDSWSTQTFSTFPGTSSFPLIHCLEHTATWCEYVEYAQRKLRAAICVRQECLWFFQSGQSSGLARLLMWCLCL